MDGAGRTRSPWGSCLTRYPPARSTPARSRASACPADSSGRGQMRASAQDFPAGDAAGRGRSAVRQAHLDPPVTGICGGPFSFLERLKFTEAGRGEACRRDSLRDQELDHGQARRRWPALPAHTRRVSSVTTSNGLDAGIERLTISALPPPRERPARIGSVSPVSLFCRGPWPAPAARPPERALQQNAILGRTCGDAREAGGATGHHRRFRQVRLAALQHPRARAAASWSAVTVRIATRRAPSLGTRANVSVKGIAPVPPLADGQSTRKRSGRCPAARRPDREPGRPPNSAGGPLHLRRKTTGRRSRRSMPPGLQSKRRVGQETGTVALKTRLPRWNTLIVAVGPNVGVCDQGTNRRSHTRSRK
jgi:hypothetical protein